MALESRGAAGDDGQDRAEGDIDCTDDEAADRGDETDRASHELRPSFRPRISLDDAGTSHEFGPYQVRLTEPLCGRHRAGNIQVSRSTGAARHVKRPQVICARSSIG